MGLLKETMEMRLSSIRAKNFKCFEDAHLDFEVKTDSPFPNIHVLLGENGTGKSALLQAIALAVLNEALRDSGLFLRAMTRRAPGEEQLSSKIAHKAMLTARLSSWGQSASSRIETNVTLAPTSAGRDRFESVGVNDENARSDLMNEDDLRSFFLVGYGADRRASPGGEYRFGVHDSQYSLRFQRVASLFRDDFYLVPLSAWYPRSLSESQHQEVDSVLAQLLGGALELTSHTEDGELVVKEDGVFLPVHALSDGYRSFLAWVCDLLWRLISASKNHQSLREVKGVVLVDEVDLHLHPQWQRDVLRTISETFNELQFIVTTHSPLIVGGVRMENVHVLRRVDGSRQVAPAESSPYGLSADQILVSSFFGLDGVRTPKFERRLDDVRQEAMSGDLDAFTRFTGMMAEGEAGDREPDEPTGKKLPLKAAINYPSKK